jgi:probable phosphoglycerate mutase
VSLRGTSFPTASFSFATARRPTTPLQGQRDIPLGARGRDQARAVGRTLRALIGAEIDRLEAADAYIASPLERTRETMEIVRDTMASRPAATGSSRR